MCESDIGRPEPLGERDVRSERRVRSGGDLFAGSDGLAQPLDATRRHTSRSLPGISELVNDLYLPLDETSRDLSYRRIVLRAGLQRRDLFTAAMATTSAREETRVA
jgi:hypothetical protein